MTKSILYTYLGTNGMITTPIHLENIYSVKKIELRADEGYEMTKDGIIKKRIVVVPEEEVDEWYEVPIEGQN
jgi:hypothetical protein